MPIPLRGSVAPAAVAGLALAGLALVDLFPPASNSFYPRCWFHETTGLLCPGCGATRALAELLHGHAASAFALNPLFVAMLPLVTIYLAMALRHKRWPSLPGPCIAALLVTAAAFGVWRNLS